MAIQDNTSGQRAIIAFSENISGAATTNGEIIDTADFDLGIMFIPKIILFNAGDYAFSILESDDPAMLTGVTTVTSAQLILPPGTTTLPTLTAASTNNVSLSRFGVFSNNRFVRISVVSTNTPSGTNRIVVDAVLMAEESPVA